jgi:hypothetical protein
VDTVERNSTGEIPSKLGLGPIQEVSTGKICEEHLLVVILVKN